MSGALQAVYQSLRSFAPPIFTTFTGGASYNVYDPPGAGISARTVSCAMSPTRVLFVGSSSTSSKTQPTCFAVVLDISGTAITVNSVATLTSIGDDPIFGLTPFDSTYAVLSTGDDGLRLIKITGSTPAVVGAALFGTASQSVGSVHGLINSTQMLVAVADYNGGAIKAAVVTRSGDTISSGTLDSLSTGGYTASQGQSFTGACGSSTTGVVSFQRRLYPVAISGTTATISGNYVDASTASTGSTAGLSFISSNLYLVSANRTSPSDNISVQTMSQSSGTSLTLNAATNFSFTAGTVPAVSWSRMYYGSTSAAVMQATSGFQMTISITGTTISSTRTNQITALYTYPASAPLTGSTVLIPGFSALNFVANVATAS